jgi:hypothetical protein
VNSIKTPSVCGLEMLGTCLAAMGQPNGSFSSNWGNFKTKPALKLAAICCPWTLCRDLVPTAGASTFTPRQL